MSGINWPHLEWPRSSMTNDELKQRLMQEMIAASPSVWRNVIATNNSGEQFEFEIGNIDTVTTGCITTTTIDNLVTVMGSNDTTSWVVTTFEELGADQPTAPNPFEEACEEEQPCVTTTEAGDFESSSPLRDEADEDDTMGCEHDPGTVGTAEQWFRNLRGDDEAPEVNPFGEPPSPPEEDDACPEPFDCPSCGMPGAMVDCGGPESGGPHDSDVEMPF